MKKSIPHLRFLAAILILLLPFAGMASGQSLSEIISFHLEKYPGTQAEDLVKLVYQGCVGPGHIGSTRDMFMNYLAYETGNMEKGQQANIDLFEPLPGEFTRLNLGPYLAKDADIGLIADGLVRSLEFTPDTTLFMKTLNDLTEEKSIDKLIPLQDRLKEIVAAIVIENIPVYHHSETYSEMYDPHYRVIHKREAERLLAELELKTR